MPTETHALDEILGQKYKKHIRFLLKEKSPLLYLSAKSYPVSWMDEFFCALRAEGQAFVFSLLGVEPSWQEDEAIAVARSLARVEQLSLRNLLWLGMGFFPEPLEKVLRMEAVLELKCFEEWHRALGETSWQKYPYLPWRRFLRKVNEENLEFFEKFLRSADEKEQQALAVNFLNEKKKVVTIFPKKWDKTSRDNRMLGGNA
jgi:hypothetical protein